MNEPNSASNSTTISPKEPEQPKLETTTPPIVKVAVPAPVVPSAAAPTPKPPTTTAAPAPAAVGGPKPVSLATAVNAAQGKMLKIPAGLTKFNTNELSSGFFHGCVYGETSARKTSTAARFGTPEDVRIILTRRKEQLMPLRELGYEAALVENGDALMFALQYPEQLWPEWASRPNRALVLDDATEAVNMLLEEAEFIDGKEVKDMRRSYREAGDNLREAIKSILNKPMHFVMVALAKVRENPLTNEERIGPDLPPSMQNMLLTELEYVFYIKTGSWNLITDRDFTSVTDVDPATGKQKTFKREIFAKHKLPLHLLGKGIIKPMEKLDLADIWRRVKEGKAS